MVVRLPETKKYLNRDGLEEYNSLLPHSSAEIQEYVDDWLDAHPEATTTVQDGSITTQKLADGSVTRNKLAADVAHLLGGMMVTGEVQGEILSADDAYSVAPLLMEIDGKSTQDGTPTPDAPVPIESIEVLELPVAFLGKNLLKPFIVESQESNGITFSMDDTGKVTMRGTATAVARFAISSTSNNPTVVPSGIYTFSTTGLPTGCKFQVYSSAAQNGFGFRESITSGKFTGTVVDGSKPFGYIRFEIASGTTVNATVNVQLEAGRTATDYRPYIEKTIVNIPMQGHVLRSLPDGTCDTMTLSYLRESDRAGWAWYGRELIQKCDVVDLGTLTWINYYGNRIFYASVIDMANGVVNAVQAMCELFQPYISITLGSFGNRAPDNSIGLLENANRIAVKLTPETAYESATAFKAAMSGIYAHIPLATPVTTTLDPVELPVLPAPTCTVWSDPSTGLRMEYVRDSNIVIQRIEEAIADL